MSSNLLHRVVVESVRLSMNDKQLESRRGQVDLTFLNFGVPILSMEQLKLGTSNSTCRLIVASSLRVVDYP